MERLCLIVDRGLGLDVLAELPAGSALVQLRDKELSGRELERVARVAREITRRHGMRLVINDRVDVALAVGADGVHLPERGLGVADARKLIGMVGASTHSPADAAARLAEGADYVVLGPIWETPGKGPALGPEALAGLPPAVLALGGVDGPERARAARAAGAHGVAVLRAVGRARALYDALA
jgi:thiamine-phosphate pyrophosphorylase